MNLKQTILAELSDLSEGSDGYKVAYGALIDTTDALRDMLKESGLNVVVDVGRCSGMGLQHNLAIKSDVFNDVLFRAYIPYDGFPVTLDMSVDCLIKCENIEELNDNIMCFFRDRENKCKLMVYKSLNKK